MDLRKMCIEEALKGYKPNKNSTKLDIISHTTGKSRKHLVKYHCPSTFGYEHKCLQDKQVRKKRLCKKCWGEKANVR